MRRLLAVLVLLGLACQRPPTSGAIEPGPSRMSVLDPDYGSHPEHLDAIGLGEIVEGLELPLADGGSFDLGVARGAGPVLLVWVGGAEHEGLITWVRSLDAGLTQLDSRGATLVFVRPLAAASSLRWAVELGLRSVVVGDPDAGLAGVLDLVGDDRPPPTIDFALLIVNHEGRVMYRKLGGRRPELDELLAVLDGGAEMLRCCPGACVGPACVAGGG